MVNKGLEAIQRVLFSTGVFYVLLGLLTFLYVNDHAALGTAKLRTLNRLMPPLNQLVAANRSHQEMDPEVLDKATFYYQYVTQYLPANPNGYFMYGYCLALGGDHKGAQAAFETAININPQYFWSHYNLGVVYLLQAKYEKAENAFADALKVPADTTVKVIFASKVFQQMMPHLANPQATIVPGLKAGYADSQRWIAVLRRLKAFPENELPESLYNQLQPIIF